MVNKTELSEINKRVFDSLGDFFLLTDENFNIVEANAPLLKKTGLTKPELLNHNALELGGEISEKQLREYQKKTSRGPVLFDFRFYEKDGSYQDYEVHYSRLKINGKKYFASVAREITRLKKLQEELKKANNRFEMIANATMEGLWETYMSTNEKWANETHQLFYGLTKEDPIPSDETWQAHIHPSYRKRVITGRENAVKRKEKNYQSEYWFKKNSGDFIYIVDRTLLEYDKEGHLIRMLGSMVDVTNLKTVQEQLKNQRNLSEDIIKSLPGVFYLVNKEGQILRWNKNLEKVTGYNSSEIKKMHPEQFFPERLSEFIRKKFAEIFKLGKIEMQVSFLNKNGKETPFYLNGWKTKYQDEDCVIGMGIDTSEEKRARTRIKKMEKEITEQRIRDQKTISRVIIQAQERERNHIARELHDNVNQLLAGARLYLNMGIKKNKEFKELIKYPIELLDSGIQEIRELTHKNITPSKELKLHELLEGLIDLLRTASIQCELLYDLEGAVNEDLRINIYRIVQEQTNNIIKHSKATKASFIIKRKNNNIIIETSDNGIGFNLHEVREGIGLYNMYSRIEAYDGEIEIDTKSGNGCRINIKIPDIAEH